MAVTTGMTLPNYNVDDFFDEHTDNKDVDETEKKMKRELKLDLYNFDSPDAENSRYILTSPRSLEACAHYSIKPVELLPKSLEDIEDEYRSLGKSDKQIKNLYEEHERDRLHKLKLCRTERERIVLDQEEGIRSTGSSPLRKSDFTMSRPSKYTKSSKPVYTRVEDGGGDVGSLQRKRTAWTTSIGHERITSEELDNRSRELYEKGKWKDDTVTTKLRKKTRNISEDPFAVRDRSWDKSFSSTSLQPKRSSSMSRLNLSNSSSSEIVMKTAGLSDKDKRIADLMKAKLLSEREQERQRELARLSWDDEHHERRKIKQQSEMQRRRNLAEMERDRERKKRLQEKQHRLMEEQVVADARRTVEFNDLQAQKTIEKQEQMKTSQLMMKKHLDEKRKKQQEQLKIAKEKEDTEFREMVKVHLNYSMSKADQIRERKEQDDHRKIQQRNKEENEKYRSRKSYIDKLSKEEKQILAESLQLKHSVASRRYDSHVHQRENEIIMNKRRKEKQLSQSRESRKAMDKEMDEWRDALLQHRSMVDGVAVQKASQTADEKARKAHELRSLNEQTQRKNLKRVKLDEEQWKRDTHDLLSIKEHKGYTLIRERESSLERSRSAARASEDVRNRIRDEYAGGFDKMAEKARLQNRIGTGVQSATKNMSTLSLG
ncbi:uncharacterized protein LOC144433997 [Glandiceps talaboti]